VVFDPFWTLAEVSHRPCGRREMTLGKGLHHGEHLITSVALRPCEVEELLHTANHRAALRRSGDDDGPASTKFQQSLVSKDPQCTQNGIGIDAEDSSEILSLGNAVTGTSLALGDGPPDLGGNLIVEGHRVGPVNFGEDQRIGFNLRRYLDRFHNANDSSVMVVVQRPPSPSADQRPPDADALFKEAKQRERRRRRWSVGVVLVVALIIITSLVADHGGTPHPVPPATSAAPASPPMVAQWTPPNPTLGDLPPGADITDVVGFGGHVLASGLLFPSCGNPGEPICASTESALEPVVWSSVAGGGWTEVWNSGRVIVGTGTVQRLVVTPQGVLLFDSGTGGTVLWRSTSDGAAFTRVSLPSAMKAFPLTDVTWGHGLTVAVLSNKFAGGPDSAYGESDAVWTSSDGTTWKQAPLRQTARLEAVTTTASGFLIGGQTKSTKRATVWTSANGMQWRPTTLPGIAGDDSETTSVTSVGRHMTAVVGGGNIGAGTYWWSDNGTKWMRTSLSGGSSGTSTNPIATPAGLIAWDGSYPAGAYGEDVGIKLWSSPNGVRWNTVILRGAPRTPNSVLEGLYPDQGGALALVMQPRPPSALPQTYQVWQLTFTR
jgi:hypothetical protein